MAPSLILAQLDSVLEDLPPRAAKTGALGTAEIIEALAERAARRVMHQRAQAILDSFGG